MENVQPVFLNLTMTVMHQLLPHKRADVSTHDATSEWTVCTRDDSQEPQRHVHRVLALQPDTLILEIPAGTKVGLLN